MVIRICIFISYYSVYLLCIIMNSILNELYYYNCYITVIIVSLLLLFDSVSC